MTNQTLVTALQSLATTDLFNMQEKLSSLTRLEFSPVYPISKQALIADIEKVVAIRKVKN